MTNFRRVFLVGREPDVGDVWVRASYEEVDGKGRLSLVGVAGPMTNGNARGSAGQIRLADMTIVPAKGWTDEKVTLLAQTWERWHMNDVTAGSPRQEEYLRTCGRTFPGHPASHYTWASDLLTSAGLNPDHEHLHDGAPYRYGSAWLYEEVPGQVLANLTDEHVFPSAPRGCPWRNL